MTPADEEREKAYGLAETLNSNLDDLSSQLSGLIDEMNHLTSKSDTKDDSLGMIVRILGEHLSSLEWLNDSANELDVKLKDLSGLSSSALTEAERVYKL